MSSAKAAVSAGSTKATSHWFANAARVRTQLSSTTSAWNTVWASRVFFTLQTIAVPLAFWFKPICVFVALFWLVYRATQVLNKPLDELSHLLGFDIPSSPLIDLASIKADGAIIHWSLAEKPKHKSQLKYEVHLNGTVIDHISIQESAVTITGLQPGAFYVVRVALLHNEFSSKSPAIRFRTKPTESGDFFNSTIDGHETDSEGPHGAIPRVRPYRALKDFTPAPSISSPMTRELSSGLGTGRAFNTRRPSPSALEIAAQNETPPNETETPEASETIQQLTERLDGIRREAEEVERQAKDEEEEELRQKDELAKERDELKSEANEKEKTSRNLKREVNTLERQNTAAQNERAKQERLLQQKKQERQKLKDDVVRWDRESEKMKVDVERIQQEKAKHLEQVAKEKETLRKTHAEESAKVRTVDDKIKAKNAEIKTLERTIKDSAPANNAPADTNESTTTHATLYNNNTVHHLQSEAEEERQWQLRKHALHQQYQLAFNKVETAKRFHAEQMRYLESLRAERRRQDEMVATAGQQQFPTPPSATAMLEGRPRRGDSQRSRNKVRGLSVSDSPRLGAFGPASNAGPFSGGPPGFNSSRFFNIQNGMTLAGPTDEVNMSDEDRERLTGGAALSPSAGADLIPADLFANEGDGRVQQHVPHLPGLGSLPGLPGLPGQLPPSQQDGNGPVSPAASSSRSPSVFASPQASQPNLSLGSPDNLADADRRSIRSTRSNRAPSGGTGSRFSGMFGIKQRNKNTSTDEGPALSKANSMPRHDQGLPGLDSASRKRNSSISGMMFGASQQNGIEGPSAEGPTAGPGRSRFGFFSSKDKSGGWPSTFTAFGRRPASPRPGSTHSNELPRPSMEGNRWGADAWPSADGTAGARGSPLGFGSAWNAPPPPQQPRMFGSRHPSRRPSVQYGASGPPEDILEDDDSDALGDTTQTPQLAPIGTKRPDGAKKSDTSSTAAKLNPNAKDFRSFLGMKFGKDKSKADTASLENSTDGGSLQPTSSGTSNLAAPSAGGGEEDGSPPNSRKSRDTRSITTAESSLAGESRSGRNSPTADLVRTPSYSNSDVANAVAGSPSLQAKESFLQKVTRKSSSSKFSLPTFKRERSRLPLEGSATSTPTAPAAEDEELGLSESVSSLRDGSKGAVGGSGRSWSSAFKLGKKSGGAKVSEDRGSGFSGEMDEDEVEDG